MKIESFIAEQVRDITAEAIIDALENDGTPTAVAAFLREQIRAGWAAGLTAAGVPDDLRAKLRFPL